jgi:hypothetical protein
MEDNSFNTEIPALISRAQTYYAFRNAGKYGYYLPIGNAGRRYEAA